MAETEEGVSGTRGHDTTADAKRSEAELISALDAVLMKHQGPAPSCQGQPNGRVNELLEGRRKALGNSTALFNKDRPLHIVRGSGCHLYDSDGGDYLDCVNNVSHVGHSNSRVAAVVTDTISTLNTNVRYLNALTEPFASLLTSQMGHSLGTSDGGKLYLTTSGSEANDLALRIALRYASAQAWDPHVHVAVMDGAYHGHTIATMALSPYKFNGSGGEGKPAWVHILPLPDVRRGLHLDGAKAAEQAIQNAELCGARIGAFFCESVVSCGGQVLLPPGYLQDAYATFRRHGALCIADEVQCGFGRTGPEMWAYHAHGVVPDMVTLAKSMGNGVPMGGLVVRGHVAASFDSTGMEYFSTCGGCTLSVAVGMAVLEELHEAELRLPVLAGLVGNELLGNLVYLQQAHSCIAAVRGVGLMLGVEFCDGSSDGRPASAVAKWVQREMLARKIILTVDGPFENVIKIKPPMVFGFEDAARLSAELDLVCREVPPYLLEVPTLQAALRDAISEAADPAALEQCTTQVSDLAAKVSGILNGATDPACTALLDHISAQAAELAAHASAPSGTKTGEATEVAPLNAPQYAAPPLPVAAHGKPEEALHNKDAAPGAGLAGSQAQLVAAIKGQAGDEADIGPGDETEGLAADKAADMVPLQVGKAKSSRRPIFARLRGLRNLLKL